MSIILRVGAVKSSRINDLHYGSGDEACSYTDADVLDIPLPEHTYQRPHPPPSTHAYSNTGYFGLPYQDHNYGMPPPPSPSRPPSPRPASPLQVNGVVQMEEEVKTTPFVSVVEEVVEDSVTRCICGYLHDDGYMICCDKCSVWQHIDCMGVDRNNIPESYFCEVCDPRILDAQKAKALQKRKREELAARNVLSDSSATDTDPEEAANALASMGKKLPTTYKKKNLKHKRSPKMTDKEAPLKLKIGKGIGHKKMKKPGKKEKENIKATAKPGRKMFKSGCKKLKGNKNKKRIQFVLEPVVEDPWNSTSGLSADAFEFVHENIYSSAVRELSSSSAIMKHPVDTSLQLPDQLHNHLSCVADVKKNRKGLRATQEIPAGQVIIEYRGKVGLRRDYDKEPAFVNSLIMHPFVLFYSKMDIDVYVDAHNIGNESRYVRRSCSPNSEVQHIFSHGNICFVIVAKKVISAGTEITIPFDYSYEQCVLEHVECACTKINCVVAKCWRNVKNSQKAIESDSTSMKHKKQSPHKEGSRANLDDDSSRSSVNSSLASPTKASVVLPSSPVKAVQLKLSSPMSPQPPVSSPVPLSNVCTLLAASALLDGQPDLVSSLKLEVPEPYPEILPLSTPLKATVSKRGHKSSVSEETVKEEKPALVSALLIKDKHKVKEPKLKDKDSKDSHQLHHSEPKKEKRPSSRRQSHEEIDDILDLKFDASMESDDMHLHPDCPKKMTREERKLDAIMKAFEQMEKRNERKKECTTSSRKCHTEGKIKKKHESESSCGYEPLVSNVPTSQATPAVPAEDVQTEAEPMVEEVQDVKPAAVIDEEVKPDIVNTVIQESEGSSCVETTVSAVSVISQPEVLGPVAVPVAVPVKEESPQKPARKANKRRRRRSRVHSAAAISDVASVSTDEGNSNGSCPAGPVSVPITPAQVPQVPVHTDLDNGGIFKFMKTKKHLFDEWSSRHEDEHSKQDEEIFVQCLPNPHVNTMDHLQRRHSHSMSCTNKTNTESSAGSAKKRWLRQAMHEVPVSDLLHQSLSVSTESRGGSPVHGAASPNPGSCLASPGASSPLDFVTPLKKRRLMRESVSANSSNGPVDPISARNLTERLTSDNFSVAPKTNGMKQFLPAHRHSTDDRLLLCKGFPNQNGLTEVVTLADDRTTGSSHLYSHNSSSISHDLQQCRTIPKQRTETASILLTESAAVSMSFSNMNGMSEAVPRTSASNSQFISMNFKGIFERMEVDSSDETVTGHTGQSALCSSRVETDGCVSNPREINEDSGIDSSASASTVVVNSHVYNAVNNLIDEGSEASFVTAKSIMNVDSPAPVCIDLNAHEMEPSLSNGNVNFDDTFFNRGLRAVRTVKNTNDCQVNSSEDVEVFPVVMENCSNICDNIRLNSSPQVVRAHDEDRTTCSDDLEQEQEVVDSSQFVNSHSLGESAASTHEAHLPEESAVVTGVCSGMSAEFQVCAAECNSSSEQANSLSESLADKSNILCDSLEESPERLSSADVSSHCDTLVEVVRSRQVLSVDENSVDDEDVQTCDSAVRTSTMLQLSFNSSVSEHYIEEVHSDNAVSESHCCEEPAFLSPGDNNVDSTSSDPSRTVSHSILHNVTEHNEVCDSEPAVSYGCCDSNYERPLQTNALYDSSATGDESSLEGLCVSSSNTLDMQSSSSWECNVPDTASDRVVFTAAAKYNSRVSQSSADVDTVSVSGSAREQPDHSQEIGSSSSSASRAGSSHGLSSSHLATQSISQSSPESPHQFLTVTSLASSTASTPEESATLSSPSCGHVSVTSSGFIVSQSTPYFPSAEATPAVKKKVSLLEYRKRLKDKPAGSGASETKSATSSAVASSSDFHHKLSPSLSMYLASSSSSAPSKSSTSSSAVRKQLMPSLATLPLFKEAVSRKDVGQKNKARTDKQLSLSDRLRLEFGLEDGGQESKTDKQDDGRQTRGSSSPPPPPPPHPPPPPPHLPASHSFTYHQSGRHSITDGEESVVSASNGSLTDGLPHPPPPSAVSGSSYTSSSTHMRAGFHGSQSSLVNGGPSSSFSYHPQLSGGPAVPHSSSGHGGRDRHGPRFAGSGGTAWSLPNQAAPPLFKPLQQQQSSSSHLNMPCSQTWTPDSHQQTWSVNHGALPAPPHSSASIRHTHHPHQQLDSNHWQSPQLIAAAAGDPVVADDQSPPPPPPPPQRSQLHLHNHHQQPAHVSSSSSSSSSTSQHRYHHLNHHNLNHSSSGKSKNSKAATSSSLSSSHHTDSRSRLS